MSGIARVLSKWGLCSRTVAASWVQAGRVAVNGVVVLDPELPIDVDDVVRIDDRPAAQASPLTIMLNKPRGLVTTARDERGRNTVYQCLEGSGLPWLAPIGRLDRASEGLLLLTNVPALAAAITDPVAGITKRYHVQLGEHPRDDLLDLLRAGIEEKGEQLRVVSAALLREGERTAWLEVVLNEGRNRHLRRMLAACGHSVRRLVRVAVGTIELGDLQKSRWRALTERELVALVGAAAAPSGRDTPLRT